jgi:outer membrane murein-binding lipoprotein Lpp
MKTVKYFIVAIILIVVLLAGLSSCATANIKNDSEKVAGYTLKNKTELMQQKILNCKQKTVIVIP